MDVATHLLFSLDGRIGRGMFWLGLLLAHLIAFAVVLAAGYLHVRPFGHEQNILFIAILVAAYPVLAVAWKRAHDRGLPGWLALLCFIPYVGLAMALYLGIAKGTPGSNAYGSDPQASELTHG